MPSRRPSAPSQAASRPSITAFRSASENARRPSGFPDASIGATRFSIVATHSSPIPEKRVRIAGAPTTMPSKYVGWRCAISMPSRPPVEQPMKYACAAGRP